MTQPRVVIDTNCLLQILGAKSKYHFLFESFLQFGYVLCISNEVLLEYEEILRMKALPLAADLFMKVIDCAFACRANYIVTNDNHFQEAANSPFPVFNVINLDDFSELMKQQ